MVSTVAARVVLVSAVASGQGKTSVTAALARKLVQRGQRVRVFKCGPDFIDPMLLERASGAPVQSLDLWMVGPAGCRSALAQAALNADVILIEGVMGLYDGTPSSADLAREFKVPVMAVIDASAMAQTAGALVQGLRDYGPVNMAGVIANRIASPGHAAMVAASLRDIPLFATLARQDKPLPERHLGLVMPAEQDDIEASIDALAEGLTFDDAAWEKLVPTTFDLAYIAAPVAPLLVGVNIAIARDAAFAFIYPANLDTLRAMGSRLTFFSPLADEEVPHDADALWLPGGYPELHGAALSKAINFKASVTAAHAGGMPILAECGGMMALAGSLVDQNDDEWQMAGLLPGQVTMQTRLGGLGSQALATPQGELRGHAFHYSVLATTAAPTAHTVKHPSGQQGEAVYRIGSLTASYFHAYFPSCPDAVAALLTRSAA